MNCGAAFRKIITVTVGGATVLPGVSYLPRLDSQRPQIALSAYMRDNNWAWTSSWFGSFTPNARNTLTLTVPANAVSPFPRLRASIRDQRRLDRHFAILIRFRG